MDWFDELPSDMDPTGWLDEVPSERDVLVDPSSSPPSTDADPISGRQGEGGTQPIQPRGSPSVHDTNAVIPAQDVAYPLRGTDTRFDPNEDLPTLAEDVFNMISDEEHADADRLWAEALQEAEERRFGLSLNVETQPAARDVREQGAVADTPMSPRYAIADELPLDIPQPQVNAEPRAGDALFVPGEVWFAAPAVETHPEHTRSENPPLGYEDTLVRDTEPGAGDTLVMAGEILAAPTRSPSGPLPPAPNDTQVQDVDPEAGASLVELENLSPRPSPAQGLGPPQAALAQRHTPRLRYSHLTEQEREILESHYQEDPKSDQWTKQRLADMLGFSLQKVKQWFSNRARSPKPKPKPKPEPPPAGTVRFPESPALQALRDPTLPQSPVGGRPEFPSLHGDLSTKGLEVWFDAAVALSSARLVREETQGFCTRYLERVSLPTLRGAVEVVAPRIHGLLHDAAARGATTVAGQQRRRISDEVRLWEAWGEGLWIRWEEVTGGLRSRPVRRGELAEALLRAVLVVVLLREEGFIAQAGMGGGAVG